MLEGQWQTFRMYIVNEYCVVENEIKNLKISFSEHLLKHKLTVVEEFHSHLEALWLIKPHQLQKQVCGTQNMHQLEKNKIAFLVMYEKFT